MGDYSTRLFSAVLSIHTTDFRSLIYRIAFQYSVWVYERTCICQGGIRKVLDSVIACGILFPQHIDNNRDFFMLHLLLLLSSLLDRSNNKNCMNSCREDGKNRRKKDNIGDERKIKCIHLHFHFSSILDHSLRRSSLVKILKKEKEIQVY